MQDIACSYNDLSKDQQGQLNKVIHEKIEKLITMHGVSGDIEVLVEYICVMLQSAKKTEDIQVELQAFLQDQSLPFVTWLGQQIQAILTGKSGKDGSSAKSRSMATPPSKADRSRSPPQKKATNSAGSRAKAGGLVGALFGRAVRDAQKSVADTDVGAEVTSPRDRKGRHEGSPGEKPKLKHRRKSARSRSGSGSSRSRSRSRSRHASGVEKALMQTSPRVKGRASALAAAMADAAASTNPHGARQLPPRPRHGAPPLPPPRAMPMHLPPHPGMLLHPIHWVPPHLAHGVVYPAPAPGPPPVAPPQPGPPPLPPPSEKAEKSTKSSSTRKGNARLAPVKMEEGEDDSRWHFQATGQPASVPPATTATAATATMPPGYSTWTQVGSTPAAVTAATDDGKARQATSQTVPTVFEFQAAAARLQVQKATSAPPRPRSFVPQKWRVAAAELVVGSSEQMDSGEVRILAEGEIVESVGPPFTLPNGVIRLEIRHPSSAAYPNPIGWISQDDSAAGGGKNLEPGPQAVHSTPSRPSFASAGWRPKGKGKGKGKASFVNMTWRPS